MSMTAVELVPVVGQTGYGWTILAKALLFTLMLIADAELRKAREIRRSVRYGAMSETAHGRTSLLNIT